VVHRHKGIKAGHEALTSVEFTPQSGASFISSCALRQGEGQDSEALRQSRCAGRKDSEIGTANTFQPHGQNYMWDQGRVHYTSNEIWFQPSAFIDEKMSKDWLPLVVEATSSKESVLDITAKTNAKKDSLSIYVVNLNDSAQSAVINVADFKFSGKAQTWVIGDCELTTLNTVNNKEAVAPKTGSVPFSKKDASYTFPKYSYTVITLRK
jgi:hypothetical protein